MNTAHPTTSTDQPQRNSAQRQEIETGYPPGARRARRADRMLRATTYISLALAALWAVCLLLLLAPAAQAAKGVGGLEPDLVEDPIAIKGLPANLIPSFQSAGRAAGGGTLGGFGGAKLVLSQQPKVLSQTGQFVTTFPVGLMDGSQRTVGVLETIGAEPAPRLPSLKEVSVPETPGLSDFVRDRGAAIALGKALFWDMQAGSDSQACASCHFHAGADNRTKNQISPGLLAGDIKFDKTASGGGGPNYQLKASDFPFHRLANPRDRNSTVLFSSNDVVSSQGSFGASFTGTPLLTKSTNPRLINLPIGKVADKCGTPPNDEFNVGGVAVRRVAARNTPTVINAAFNHRNFWDGRANNVFNGVNPFGERDPDARVLMARPDGSTWLTKVALRNASLASQAVGPALSEFEMSCDGRQFGDLARRLLTLRPLGRQDVHAQDSVLGRYRHQSGKGLAIGYTELIKAAFQPQWWSAKGQFTAPGATAAYSHIETNFSLYWGLAIMMYESTLISDDAPIDRFIGGAGSPGDVKALSESALRGLELFQGKAQCSGCHRGAEFTSAATGLQPSDSGEELVENMLMNDGQLAHYDNGFYNIGVRPTVEDRGLGGTDPWGNPLSFSRNWYDHLRGRSTPESLAVDTCGMSIFFEPTACSTTPDPTKVRVAVDGSFKTPTLRNVGLTRPYFHNGGSLTLAQVVAFYNRGGDRRGPDSNDTTGLIEPDAINGGTTNMHPDVKRLNLSPAEQADLVTFMRHGLTDRRVACKQAPFDHPGIRLTNGHAGDEETLKGVNQGGFATDNFINLAAVGAAGVAEAQCLKNDDGSAVPPT